MSPNLSSIERVMRLLLGAILLFAAALLFQHPVMRLLIAVFGAFVVAEAMTAKCPLIARVGTGSSHLLGLAGIQMVLAYEWLSAGWGKLSDPAFVGGMGKTLGYFASANPFPWYKGFLLGFASKNAALFAYTVEWSQLAVAVVLLASAVTLIYSKNSALRKKACLLAMAALAGGALMSANFYLAAGWTGPGTKGVNIVMFWAQAMLIYVWAMELRKDVQGTRGA